MMTTDFETNPEFSLLRRMPAVLRARDFRLYTGGKTRSPAAPGFPSGKRLVDLWQNGGAAVLGHTPPSLLRELKNTAGRGLYAPFPHFLEDRYRKALSRIFPDSTFRIYAAPPPELYTLVAEKRAALWRPFLEPAAPLSVPKNAPPLLIPVVPGIQGWHHNLPLGLCVLVIAPGFAESNPLPPGDLLSPVLLAAAVRGIYDLIAAAPQRAKPVYPRIGNVLKSSRWQRNGIYLALKQPPSPEEWSAIFSRFLEAGFLLPPVSAQPAILPGVLSPGEEAKLAALLVD